jgi:hypothetical protein
MVAGNMTEIRTEYHPNTSVDRYPTQLFLVYTASNGRIIVNGELQVGVRETGRDL